MLSSRVAPGRQSGRGLATGWILLCLLAAPAGAAGPPLPCTGSGQLEIQAGSVFDLGSSGSGHDQSMGAGYSIPFEILRRCTTNQFVCGTNSDCGAGSCKATCDCVEDTACEIRGPVRQKRCEAGLATCESNADCGGGPCSFILGTPLDIDVAGTPGCVSAVYDAPFTGTLDVASGQI